MAVLQGCARLHVSTSPQVYRLPKAMSVAGMFKRQYIMMIRKVRRGATTMRWCDEWCIYVVSSLSLEEGRGLMTKYTRSGPNSQSHYSPSFTLHALYPHARQSSSHGYQCGKEGEGPPRQVPMLWKNWTLGKGLRMLLQHSFYGQWGDSEAARG